MPKFLIEREMPGAGKLSARQLMEFAQTSVEVLQNMDARIQWIESYVTGNKLYCIYSAPDADTILEHASFGGLPATKVSEIKAIIDPVTAEG